MSTLRSSQLQFELLWWLLAATVAACALLPPWIAVGRFLFVGEIAILIVGFITWTRMLFFLRQIAWLRPVVVKAIVAFICIPVIFYAVWTLNNVQTFVDAEGLAALFLSEPGASYVAWGTYLRSLAVFSASSWTIAAVILPVLLILQAFRQFKDRPRKGLVGNC